jgi:hypothetical protein
MPRTPARETVERGVWHAAVQPLARGNRRLSTPGRRARCVADRASRRISPWQRLASGRDPADPLSSRPRWLGAAIGAYLELRIRDRGRRGAPHVQVLTETSVPPIIILRRNLHRNTHSWIRVPRLRRSWGTAIGTATVLPHSYRSHDHLHSAGDPSTEPIWCFCVNLLWVRPRPGRRSSESRRIRRPAGDRRRVQNRR